MPTDPNQLKLAKELSRKEILLCIARVPNSNRVFVGTSDGKILDVDVLAEKPEFQELAGHMDLATTQRYMHLSPAAIEGAIRLLDRTKPVRGFGDILETEERETAKSRV